MLTSAQTKLAKTCILTRSNRVMHGFHSEVFVKNLIPVCPETRVSLRYWRPSYLATVVSLYASSPSLTLSGLLSLYPAAQALSIFSNY